MNVVSSKTESTSVPPYIRMPLHRHQIFRHRLKLPSFKIHPITTLAFRTNVLRRKKLVAIRHVPNLSGFFTDTMRALHDIKVPRNFVGRHINSGIAIRGRYA